MLPGLEPCSLHLAYQDLADTEVAKQVFAWSDVEVLCIVAEVGLMLLATAVHDGGSGD